MSRAWYCTRERVMRASDLNASAYRSAEIDAAIESASIAVDKLCKRGDDTRPAFAPWTGEIVYDWPVDNNDNAYKFWLGRNSLLSFDEVVSGGIDITTDCQGWPNEGPPFRAIEVNQASSNLLTFVDGVGQQSLTISGVWCAAPLAERSSAPWVLAGSMDASTQIALIAAPIGVGSIVRVGTERMFVTERTWTTSSQTGSLASSMAAQTLAVSDGTAFLVGEELLLDAERVLVRDIAGNNVIVTRAWNGSTLAAHTSATIYQARSCTVERGALGTTAASHSASALVLVFQPPWFVEQLTVAYAQDQREQEAAAYSRTIGSGEAERMASGRSIKDLEDKVLAAYGRQLRYRASA